MKVNKRKSTVLNVCLTALLCICLFAAGTGLLLKPDAGKLKSSAIEGQGTAIDPYIIDSLQAFSNLVPYMMTPGTVTNQKYFVITQPIDMTGLNPNITRTLANYVVIDGKNSAGQPPVLTNLNSSLFDNVVGPNSVIKNIRFTGTGNIARNFSGILDNVHHISGWVSNLNATSVGGLVNFSENATIRYCSNAATVSRSTGESSQLVNGGIIGVASGTLHMTNTSNSAEILTMGTVQASGGLVGKILNSGVVATIELSYNTGLVNGQCSGGLVGIKEGSGRLVIKECYNTGRVSNRETVTNAPTGGILALASGGIVDIESCYNRGNVRVGTATSETSTTQTTNSAGIFSTNKGATVTVSKSYNTGMSRYAISGAFVTNVNDGADMTDCFVLSGTFTNAGAGVNVTSTTQGVICSANTVNTLNPAPPASPIFMLPGSSVNNGYPVLVGLTVATYTFGANGGSFIINGEAVYSLRFSQEELLDAGAGITFERPCFTFVGFCEDAQAQPNDTRIFTSFDAAPRGGAYYAIWDATKYFVSFAKSPGFEAIQNYALNDASSDDPSQSSGKWAFVIGQNIYLQTWLNGSTSLQDYFIGWEIKTGPGENEFAPFYEGFSPVLPPSTTLEERLNLSESGVSLITEEFINTYTVYLEEGSIVLRGLYQPNATSRLDIDAWTVNGDINKVPTYRNWGKLKVNGNETRFPRSERFSVSGSFTVSVKPNDHYSLQGFQVLENDGEGGLAVIDEIPVEDLEYENGYFYEDFVFTDNRTIYAVFEPVAYKVSVIAMAVGDDNPISNVDGLVKDDRVSEYVTVNEAIKDITVSSNSEYKLINASRNNFKIKNQLTDLYDFRSTNSSGEINIIANSLFLGNYWNQSWLPTDTSKSIELVLIFVKLEQLKVEIAASAPDAPVLGSVSVFIRDGSAQSAKFDIESFDESLGLGSTVTIVINVPHNALLSGVEENNAPWSMPANSQTIRFNLDRSYSFVITLVPRSFMLDVAAVDNNGDRHPVHELPGISTRINGTEWDKGGLAAGDTISITKTKDPETLWEDEWRFDGWFLVYGDNQNKQLSGNPAYDFDLVEENAVVIDESFINEFLSENISFTVEARFVKIFNVTVSIALEDSGGAKSSSGEDLVGLTQCSATQSLVIRLLPDKHYFVANVTVNGTDYTPEIAIDIDGPYITVDVTEELFINIAYEAEQTAVTDTYSQSNGKITISKNKIGIGSDVVIRFTPKTGFQRADWTINGIPVEDINSEFEGSYARVSGNTVSFKITSDWYEKWGSKLNSEVDVELNTFLVIGIAAIAIVIPILIIGIVLMILANKKRKAEYAVALQKMKTAKVRMGTADFIKSLKEE